ncbi:hypothetical protein Taro_035248 [Colocasia esculenta]|uniref:Methyltransferase type 11 domain-containing protein n=1 Tax=Colocasia esculenta TaxID=4460 RepID=A0A843VTU2_COLES|nr:hypothetical protein [Colocasia esculenta]
MAEFFHKQKLAENYAEGRPSYPPELFQFIASKTPCHHVAWDVATGSGQAVVSLAGIYETVVATDVSAEQLAHAQPLPNVHYRHTPPSIPLHELERYVAPPTSVDLVTVAQAIHWFDLPSFYGVARHALRRPGGVLAAWCYTLPRVNDQFDAVIDRFYEILDPYWAPQRRLVDERYVGLEFPFDPVQGEEHTGPFEFMVTREMDLAAVLTYLRSWSAYHTALEKGVDLLAEAQVGELRRAWGGDAAALKLVRFPVYLRIGRVGGG